MVVSSPTTSRRVKLREIPWLMKKPWHTENEKRRIEGLWNRLYLNPRPARKEVYEKYKPEWMTSPLSFEERLKRLREKKK